VVHGARKAGVGLADHVVVIGAGAMGLLNLQVFKAMGAIVTAVEIQEERCRRALNAGADYAYTPDEAVERVNELTGGYGPDLVVVAASAPEAYDLGRELLSSFGRLLAFSSVYPNGETAVDMSHLHRSGQHLVGAVSSDIDDILVVGKIISHELIDLTQVIDSVVPFEQIPEALERALQPNTYRVVLRM
jgi:L-iditol 2-dehydrogenase